MNITINGKTHTLAQAGTVADLVRELGYENKRIAIERNGDIVPRSQYQQTPLSPDDQLEIVVAVGGG